MKTVTQSFCAREDPLCGNADKARRSLRRICGTWLLCLSVAVSLVICGCGKTDKTKPLPIQKDGDNNGDDRPKSPDLTAIPLK